MALLEPYRLASHRLLADFEAHNFIIAAMPLMSMGAVHVIILVIAEFFVDHHLHLGLLLGYPGLPARLVTDHLEFMAIPTAVVSNLLWTPAQFVSLQFHIPTFITILVMTSQQIILFARLLQDPARPMARLHVAMVEPIWMVLPVRPHSITVVPLWLVYRLAHRRCLAVFEAQAFIIRVVMSLIMSMGWVHVIIIK